MKSNTGQSTETNGRNEMADRKKVLERIYELVDEAKDQDLYIILAAIRGIRRI